MCRSSRLTTFSVVSLGFSLLTKVLQVMKDLPSQHVASPPDPQQMLERKADAFCSLLKHAQLPLSQRRMHMRQLHMMCPRLRTCPQQHQSTACCQHLMPCQELRRTMAHSQHLLPLLTHRHPRGRGIQQSLLPRAPLMTQNRAWPRRRQVPPTMLRRHMPAAALMQAHVLQARRQAQVPR